MQILKCLNQSKIIKNFNITDFKLFKEGFYIKIKAELINGELLFIREFVDDKERNYSYHLQNRNGELIARWDNAPHHPDLYTFPHHKHLKENIFENTNIDCYSILQEIEKILIKKK